MTAPFFMTKKTVEGQSPGSFKRRAGYVAIATGALIAVGVAVALLYFGSRYVTVEYAYIRAANAMVSPDVSGVISRVNVKEGQRVKAGDVLFELDTAPFIIALKDAEASLQQAGVGVAAEKARYQEAIAQTSIESAKLDLARQTYDRYLSLSKTDAISASQLDQAKSDLLIATASVEAAKRNADGILSQLKGNPNLPTAISPQYQKALAAVEEARRKLANATVRAPFDGVVTDVRALQPGMQVSASGASSAIGLVSTDDMWIEARLKETQLEFVREGNAVTIKVDAYPGQEWAGQVEKISIGSDSLFSVLPTENSSANWVKVVQRIPVYISVSQDGREKLRAGMSVAVSIDTGQRRWPSFFTW